MSKRIAKLLRQALLKNGAMAYALYEHEFAEHIDYWYAGLQRDQDAFVFAMTENSGDTAMVLITPAKEIYVNEAAREKLAQLWHGVYKKNLTRLIPMMARELGNNIIAVNGVKYVAQEGHTLKTLARGNHFDVVTVDTQKVIVRPHVQGIERHIKWQVIEDAFSELVQRGEITRVDIRDRYTQFNPAYVAAILAALPDVTFTQPPIHLFYQSKHA